MSREPYRRSPVAQTRRIEPVAVARALQTRFRLLAESVELAAVGTFHVSAQRRSRFCLSSTQRAP